MVIPASSTEYLHVPVTAPAGVDITGSPPRLAILPAANRDNPAPGDWITGAWTDGLTARLLIGPDGGSVALTPGSYRVYVAVDPPGAEHIVRMAGYISVS